MHLLSPSPKAALAEPAPVDCRSQEPHPGLPVVSRDPRTWSLPAALPGAGQGGADSPSTLCLPDGCRCGDGWLGLPLLSLLCHLHFTPSPLWLVCSRMWGHWEGLRPSQPMSTVPPGPGSRSTSCLCARCARAAGTCSAWTDFPSPLASLNTSCHGVHTFRSALRWWLGVWGLAASRNLGPVPCALGPVLRLSGAGVPGWPSRQPGPCAVPLRSVGALKDSATDPSCPC